MFSVGFAWAQVKPIVSQRNLNDQINVVRLAPRYATAIRMPEAVSSVIVGDPAKFLAEHAEKEPTLVLVKPVVEEAVESNLLVTTIRGRQVSFLLRSAGAGPQPVDFVLAYKPVGTFLIEETGIGSTEVPATERIGIAAAPIKSRPASVLTDIKTERHDPLDELLQRQRRASMPELHGMNPPTSQGTGDRVLAGFPK